MEPKAGRKTPKLLVIIVIKKIYIFWLRPKGGSQIKEKVNIGPQLREVSYAEYLFLDECAK